MPKTRRTAPYVGGRPPPFIKKEIMVKRKIPFIRDVSFDIVLIIINSPKGSKAYNENFALSAINQA
jgi:hypothetical protein